MEKEQDSNIVNFTGSIVCVWGLATLSHFFLIYTTTQGTMLRGPQYNCCWHAFHLWANLLNFYQSLKLGPAILYSLVLLEATPRTQQRKITTFAFPTCSILTVFANYGGLELTRVQGPWHQENMIQSLQYKVLLCGRDPGPNRGYKDLFSIRPLMWYGALDKEHTQNSLK